jgi:hypothetical protein
MVQPLMIAESLEARSQKCGPVLRFLGKRLARWLTRHRHPVNLAIHLAGIPMAVTGVVLLFYQPWYWGLSFFVAGYFLQYLGHKLEGNDVGEWAGIKRIFGLQYVGVSPRWEMDKVASRKPPA